MVDFDVQNDTLPKLPFASPDNLPTISALKTAISGSGVSAKYPASFMNSATRNDLIYACRIEDITVPGLT